MKKSILAIIILCMAICSFLFISTSCSCSGEIYEGTYYLYSDNVYYKNDWIKLDTTWTDSNNNSGEYSISKDEIVLYYIVDGERVPFLTGKISNGIVEFNLASGTIYYSKFYEFKVGSEGAITQGQLARPIISVEDNKIECWSSGENLRFKYTIMLNGKVDDHSFERDNSSSYSSNGTRVEKVTWSFPSDAEGGIYTIKIQVLGDGINTFDSDYTVLEYKHNVLPELTNLAYNEETAQITWDKIEGCESYQLFINNEMMNLNGQTFFDLSEFDAGIYSIKVIALRNGWLSSQAMFNISKNTLKAPKVSSYVNSDDKALIIKWDGVKDATGYVISVGNNDIKLSSTYYVLPMDSTLWVDKNEISYTVNAVDGSGKYKASACNKTYTAKKLYALSLINDFDENTYYTYGEFYKPVVVSFDLNGAEGTAPNPQTLNSSTGLTYPEIPTRDGYIFRGWYTEPECKTVFDFSATVYTSTTLYAGWYEFNETSNKKFIEINDKHGTYEITTSSLYLYFRSLPDKILEVYYWQSRLNVENYVEIYDVTNKETLVSETFDTIDGLIPAHSTIITEAGHVYYARFSSSSSNTIYTGVRKHELNFDYNDSILPTDGGTAVLDYVVHNISYDESNVVSYGNEYVVYSQEKLGYAAVLKTETGETVGQRIKVKGDEKYFISEWEIADEMKNFEFTATADSCVITGVIDKTITQLIIPHYVTKINSGVFSDCISVTYAECDDAFTGFLPSKTKELVITKGKKIGYLPSELNKITIPDSIISFVSDDVLRKLNVANIVVSENNPVYKSIDGNLYSKDGKTLIKYATKKSASTFAVPSNVTNVGKYAFYSCYLKSVTIGNNVTDIGEYAFGTSRLLTTINISDSVSFIGEDAFDQCYELTKVNYLGTIDKWCHIFFTDASANPLCWAHSLYINDELVTNAKINVAIRIGDYAFINNTSLESITIGRKVESIGEYSFDCCKCEIIIEGGLMEIGSFAFSNYRGESITIPDSVTIFDEDAFISCENLKKINYIGGIGSWCQINFANESANPLYYAHNLYLDGVLLTEAKMDTAYKVKDYVFAGCTSLEKAVIGNSATDIGQGAFAGCAGLTSVTIGNSVTSIGSGAFKNSACEIIWGNNPTITEIGAGAFSEYKGTSITIPDSVTSIGSSAFSGCRNLTSVTIGNGVTSIGNSAFYNCGSLKYNEYDNAYYLGNDNNKYVALIKAKNNEIASVSINSGTKIIWTSAFYNCSSLTSIIIPDNVTSIGDHAFYNCRGLTSVTIGNSVANIGERTFCSCTSLASIIIGNNVKSIGYEAFYGCSELKSVTIPESVTSIGDYAFYACRGLTSITIGNGVTSIGYRAFDYCSSLTSVTFNNTNGWKVYAPNTATNGTSVTVTNTSWAATRLTSTYVDKYWKRG